MEAQPQDPYATLGVPRTATQPEIRKAYLKLVRENPPESEPEAFARINDAYAILGNAEKRAAFDAAPVWPADALEAAKEAVAAAQAERFDDACRLLEPVVAKHPGFEPLERLYAQALLGAERYAEALPIWRRAVDARPDDVGALYALGAAVGAGGKGDMEEAVRLLKRAITLAPDDPECAIGLGRTYLRMGRAEDAAAAFARGMERHPEPGPARLAFRVEILRGARLLPGSADAEAARARLRSDAQRVEPAVRNDAFSRLWNCARAFASERRFDLFADLMGDLAEIAPDPEGAARARAASESARREHAFMEACRALRGASVPRWIVELVDALHVVGDVARAKDLLLRLAASCADAARANLRASEFSRARAAHETALERVESHVRGALVAGLSFRRDSDYFRLLADPTVSTWIKDLALIGHEALGIGSRTQLGPFLKELIAADPRLRGAEIEEAAAAYPGAADDLRARFAEFSTTAAARPAPAPAPAAATKVTARERDARRPVNRPPPGAAAARRGRHGPTLAAVALIALLATVKMILRGCAREERDERPAPVRVERSAREFSLQNARFRLTPAGDIEPLDEAARRFLNAADAATLAALRRIAEHPAPSNGR